MLQKCECISNCFRLKLQLCQKKYPFNPEKGGVESTINSGEIREGLHEHYVKIRGWPEPRGIESWSGVHLQIMHQMPGNGRWTPTGFNLLLARAYQGKIEGLCGNMNRNFADDFTLKDGQVLSISDSRFIFYLFLVLFSIVNT